MIGRRTSRVSAEEVLDYVFGYTVVNDVSARTLQFDHGQLILGKGVDTFCPIGPEIVTQDEIPDPLQLRVRSYVNDELKQDGTTANMIFSPQAIIALISDVITLEPGDVISAPALRPGSAASRSACLSQPGGHSDSRGRGDWPAEQPCGRRLVAVDTGGA